MPPSKPLITAAHLYRFQLLTDCMLSPDGEHVVYVLQRVERRTEKKYSNLWLVPTGSGRPRQFTFGSHTDMQPRWSPDGRAIAFLSDRGTAGQFQICSMPLHGGEARPLTALHGSFGQLSWAPSGRQLVFEFQKQDADAAERERDAHKKKLGVVARHIKRLSYKMDGAGFLPNERWHIWLLDARNGRAQQLTDGARDESDPAFSPDSAQIVYCSNHSAEPDLTPGAVDLFLRTVARTRTRKLAAPYGPKSAPVFSPDGRWIAYYGLRGEPEGWENTNLWVLPLAGGAPRNLTGALDVAVADGTINDLPGGPVIRPPAWSTDSTRIYFQVARHGDTLLQSITLAGAASVQTVVAGAGTVGAFSLDAAQRRVAYLAGSMASTDELCVQVLAAATIRQLTRHNTAMLQGLRLGTVEELWFSGAARNPLQGWILKPPGFNPARKYPSILQIHGGPWAQYGNYFMHEFYFLAARGYVVYFCNPRGGQGYGEKHAKAILNKFGTADYADLMAFTDLVQRKRYIDRQRMGVTGGSYGGFMTSWIIGHTQRFKAAVVQRTVTNWTSMVGSSDGNTFFRRWLGHKAPWEDLQNYWRQSPIAHIGNARTPTLVIHSEQDMRCEIEQGEQLFVALKTLGVETEMVRFPDESHGLSRGGRTDRRVARLEHIARWFDRYLKP